MMQEIWNAPPGFRPTKSAPCSPAKPLGVSRTRSESFHVTHKVPVGDTPYVQAKHVQLVDKDPEKAIPLFWAAINAGDRVDSALKDMAIVMKQQNRAEEAIEAIKSLRTRCSDQAQESLDNILLDLYKRCGRLDDQIALLRHKLYLIQQGLAFNGKRTKTARSQGKKFQVSVEQEATRLLGNLGWALMQQNNYKEAEDAYRRALSIAPDNNKMCNLGICLMKQGRITEAKETLRLVKPAVSDGPRGMDSHLKAYERAQQMLADLESEMMKKGGDSAAEQSRLFDAFLGSSSIWQPQPCKDNHVLAAPLPTNNNLKQFQYSFSDENLNSNIGSSQNFNLARKKPVCPPGYSNPKQFQDDFPDENISSNIGSIQSFNLSQKKPVFPPGYSLNIDAAPFYSSKIMKEPTMNHHHHNNQLHETLKRTRSINGGNSAMGEVISTRNHIPERENKMRRRSLSFDDHGDRLTDLLPDEKDFEEAIMSSVFSANDAKKPPLSHSNKMKIGTDKRLQVFQDITVSLSPRA